MRIRYKNRWLVCLVVLTLLFCTGCGNQKTSDLSVDATVKDEQMIEQVETEVSNQGGVAQRLDFPIEIEDGKLAVESVFQYSGLNLDAEDAICEEIGAVQLKNASTEYLERADVVVTLSDGTELKFCIEDLPSGESIIAFEVQNQVYDVSQSVEHMTAKAKWGNAKLLPDDKVTVVADGLQLIVENTSGSTLKNLKVVYHCELDGVFFGGKGYEGTIEELEAGKSVVLDALECYLGEAVVVYVGE